jgi:hypothetical protein
LKDYFTLLEKTFDNIIGYPEEKTISEIALPEPAIVLKKVREPFTGKIEILVSQSSGMTGDMREPIIWMLKHSKYPFT